MMMINLHPETDPKDSYKEVRVAPSPPLPVTSGRHLGLHNRMTLGRDEIGYILHG